MPKASAALPDGATFLETVVRTARASGADPVVVVTSESTPAPTGSIRVDNPDPSSEQIVSLRRALARLANTGVDGVLVWPVDCPLVRADTVAALMDAAGSDEAEIVIPTFAGRQGHPTWFAREVWGELMVASEDGAREVIRRDPGRVQRVLVADPAVLADLDTREDLARVLAGASVS